MRPGVAMRQRVPQIARQAGFTLIELAVVIVIMGVIAAMTFPQFLPLIAFSEHETTARHLAGYSDAVVSYATLTRQTVTLRINLDDQFMETTHLVDTAKDEAEGEDVDQMALLEQMRGGDAPLAPEEMASLLAGGGDPSQLPPGFDMEKMQAQLNDKFDLAYRQMLEARAKNVKHPDSMLDEVQLFDEKDKFKLDEEQLEDLPVDDPLLEHTTWPKGVRLESVSVDGEVYKKGVVELEVTALGLSQLVGLYLRGEDGTYYTVVLNPLNSRADVVPGAAELS